MALVRRNIFLHTHTFSYYFQGVLLVFEYAWFLLQQTKNVDNNLITLAIKAYQTSGTQAAVLNALQPAIEEHCDDPDTLTNVIIGIIHMYRMCKLIFIQEKI